MESGSASSGSCDSDSEAGERADSGAHEDYIRKGTSILRLCQCCGCVEEFLARNAYCIRALICVCLVAATVALCAFPPSEAADEPFAYAMLGSLIGAAPGLLRRRPSKVATPPRGLRRALHIGAVLVVTITVAAAPCLQLPKGPSKLRFLYMEEVSLCSVLLPVVVACVGARHPPSIYARCAVWCVVALWLVALLRMSTTGLRVMLPALEGTDDDARAQSVLAPGPQARYFTDAQLFLLAASYQMEGVVVSWIASMMLQRLAAVQGAASMSARRTKMLLGVMSIALHCNIFRHTLPQSTFYQPDKFKALYLLSAMLFLSTYVWYIGELAWSIACGMNVMRREAMSTNGAPQAEARWAAKVFRGELAACLLIGCTTTATWLLKTLVLLNFDGFLGSASGFVHRCAIVANAWALAALSGLIWQAERPVVDGYAGQGGRKNSERIGSVAAVVMGGEGDEDLWASKVLELANRGVRLSDLLDFWRLLHFGGAMPGFDPWRSTTNDVARQVIIPMSRLPNGGGRALASVWSDGKPRLAECMVTHNWSNLFWHLLAATVADALDDQVYGPTADALLDESTFEGLLEELGSRQKLHKTFWICAFSVNQHASICDGFGREPPPGTAEHAEWDAKRRSTTTQELFAVCRCGQRKVLNDQPAACEMNKFDGMMRFLWDTQGTRFSHLIVVDVDFEVFRRAWCVAEIVESHISCITQRVKIHSEELLDSHYSSLMNLDVRECRASCAEDKAMILGAIPDIDEFNSALSWTIFGTAGLFSHWFDGQERATLVGRILQRARTSAADELDSDDHRGFVRWPTIPLG